ncbi:cell shape determining protein, MreB-like [Oenococcus oeni ATCC BAA-1163]|uniref:Cell shape-determining protein MreB n=2 Tax=Oenococcus oeni TaxID=1247 RepID=A0NID7_OENOE|nr:rod shape-determining protein [Oenococcus oeni]EAV39712.1 cell shape determining protein, MreB-like [Oenococcus oeni ATCC BAA-1163]KDE87288.1 rod shape-determining protein MreB [Oenococcus oeni]KGH60809.1 rod shape-determining protein MreB [Oenococcus oeni IOEB_9805]KGH71279.1 rod shape-determining protein MreB [Oenococcus oeni IOEB_0502]KGH74838.1 rod shape-determining protein MreB [Oenococcus oeni IOEB_9803]
MAKDIGIDLGTANVLIYVEGQGIALNEPSVVAIDVKTDKVLAIGSDAYKWIDRGNQDIRVVRPLKDGVISDFDATEAMLTTFVNQLRVKGWMSRPNIMICAPTNITEIERKAIIQAAQSAGGANVYLEYEPKVAAVGAGLDIFDFVGSMVIDIGGGTSDIAVLSGGDIVASRSLRMAGDQLTQDIIRYLRLQFGILIGMPMAERIKQDVGSSLQVTNPIEMTIRGQDLNDANSVKGLPKQVTIDSNDIEEAMHATLNTIVRSAKEILGKIQPGLAGDIIDRGIMLTGGGALLGSKVKGGGIDTLLQQELHVPVNISESPLDNVAKGAGTLLEYAKRERHNSHQILGIGNPSYKKKLDQETQIESNNIHINKVEN